ncbi:WD40/YVTN/BNR-like repeat-containing protein [Nocardioides sp. LHG3406-4]|uniref:WD40/YVTN/BNR-like repeat-containing protein n=1 Tax=Nocardioides sp. LHG3406-4 TaxID=2804575 RepID=UPI003CF3CCB3
MRTLLGTLAALTMAVVPLTAAAAAEPKPGSDEPSHHNLGWKRVDVDTDQGLRGLDAVSGKVAWVTGSEGGVWRTVDGGTSWKDVTPAAQTLMLRDVEATSKKEALVLAIGPGEESQILRTDDGGESWATTFVNDEPAAFYDCMAMFPNGRDGLALSDPVDGQLRLIRTRDGGRSWSRVGGAGLPKPVADEFYFAASGTCLVTSGDRDAWIVSGGGAARVLHSTDRGRTWKAADSTLAPGAAAGVFSIAVRDDDQAVLVGGDFEQETDGADRSAYLSKKGKWVNGGDLAGYRSGVAWLPGTRGTAVAVGPSGSDVTRDGGRTWKAFSAADFDSVQCADPAPVEGTRLSCWASGAEGAVGRLKVRMR